jgi:hypothetical protein
MRIAVLVYGRLNGCLQHYDNILDSIGIENDIDFFASSDNPSQEHLDEFINLYKPVKYANHKTLYDVEHLMALGSAFLKTPETNLHNMSCHFINKHRVFLLLEMHIEKENIHYDVVISLRIDVVFNNKIIFSNIEDNTIYIPEGPERFDYGGINDQLAYGNFSVMKKYNNIYLNMNEFLKSNKSILHPETLTLTNICFHNLKIIRPNILYRIERI